MKIQVLCDNALSWILPYAEEVVKTLKDKGHDAILIFLHEEVVEGDILVLLSCEKIFSKLHLNKHNLVVHESDLPRGRGWSPLTWQILENKNKIPVTLFEATEKVDSGPIYGQVMIEFTGTELIDELREKQGHATKQLILNFAENYSSVVSRAQNENEATYYKKRKPENSQLDPDKSIAEQFNLLRVCDNERYPAFFELNGKRYILKIFNAD